MICIELMPVAFPQVMFIKMLQEVIYLTERKV